MLLTTFEAPKILQYSKLLTLLWLPQNSLTESWLTRG